MLGLGRFMYRDLEFPGTITFARLRAGLALKGSLEPDGIQTSRVPSGAIELSVEEPGLTTISTNGRHICASRYHGVDCQLAISAGWEGNDRYHSYFAETFRRGQKGNFEGLGFTLIGGSKCRETRLSWKRFDSNILDFHPDPRPAKDRLTIACHQPGCFYLDWELESSPSKLPSRAYQHIRSLVGQMPSLQNHQGSARILFATTRLEELAVQLRLADDWIKRYANLLLQIMPQLVGMCNGLGAGEVGWLVPTDET